MYTWKVGTHAQGVQTRAPQGWHMAEPPTSPWCGLVVHLVFPQHLRGQDGRLPSDSLGPPTAEDSVAHLALQMAGLVAEGAAPLLLSLLSWRPGDQAVPAAPSSTGRALPVSKPSAGAGPLPSPSLGRLSAEGTRPLEAARWEGPREGLAGTQPVAGRRKLCGEEEQEEGNLSRNSRGDSDFSQEAGGAETAVRAERRGPGDAEPQKGMGRRKWGVGVVNATPPFLQQHIHREHFHFVSLVSHSRTTELYLCSIAGKMEAQRS